MSPLNYIYSYEYYEIYNGVGFLHVNFKVIGV
jgi:hypothetical protein